MRLKCFSRLDQRLQARKDTRPPRGCKNVSWVIIGPQVMRHGDLGCFGLGYEVDRYTRLHRALAQSVGVLQESRRFDFDDLAVDVDRALAIRSGSDPLDRAAWLQVCYKFRTTKDDTVGLRGYKAFPNLLGRCREVEYKMEWGLICHGMPRLAKIYSKWKIRVCRTEHCERILGFGDLRFFCCKAASFNARLHRSSGTQPGLGQLTTNSKRCVCADAGVVFIRKRPSGETAYHRPLRLRAATSNNGVGVPSSALRSVVVTLTDINLKFSR